MNAHARGACRNAAKQANWQATCSYGAAREAMEKRPPPRVPSEGPGRIHHKSRDLLPHHHHNVRKPPHAPHPAHAGHPAQPARHASRHVVRRRRHHAVRPKQARGDQGRLQARRRRRRRRRPRPRPRRRYRGCRRRPRATTEDSAAPARGSAQDVRHRRAAKGKQASQDKAGRAASPRQAVTRGRTTTPAPSGTPSSFL